MVTIPSETTEPGRERDNSLGSFSAAVGLEVDTGIGRASESGISAGDICLELRRGGGNKDAISGSWSGIGGNGRGAGKEGIVGVSNCKKLESFCEGIILSAMGEAGCGIRVAAVWSIKLVTVFECV